MWKFDLVPAPAPGTKACGFIDFGDPMFGGWEWPYIAVNGASPGRAIAVTAGIHGAEYPSIDAVARLGAALKPEQVRGQVLCLPVVNPPAFWERTPFVTPVDGINLNRVFPGKKDGRFSERLAYLLFERAIGHADVYIDLHGGDLVEDLEPYTVVPVSGDSSVDQQSQALAASFGLPNVVMQRPADSPVTGQAFVEAARRGIPSILPEAGGCGLNQPEAIGQLEAGLLNSLRALEILPGPADIGARPRTFVKWAWIRAAVRGFFRPSVKAGTDIAAGQRIGTLTNLFGQEIGTIVSPAKGRVLFMTINPAIAKDGLVAGVGVDAG